MEVKKIDDTQITNAIDLIWQTFLQFEAPDYSEEGVKSFQEFIENKEIVKTLEFWGAYDEEELKGVIATNENRKHICCFFESTVSKTRHWQKVVELPTRK